MNPGRNGILTINGGSSSIKIALFDATNPSQRVLKGRIERIGSPGSTFNMKGTLPADNFERELNAPDHEAAVEVLMDWVQERFPPGELLAVGHRVVHGGPKYLEAQLLTPQMVADLHEIESFDPEHLPEEILLTEAFEKRFPGLRQVACFDTAFHRDLPQVARLLPLPRRYEAKGVRRYGFHGLSYSFLLEELGRIAPSEAHGPIIMAHLGNGASLAAVRVGRPVDTTMAFTPTAGIPMSTRSGDLDAGLVWYLARMENLSAKDFNDLVNSKSGLLGISETSSDMRDLLDAQGRDPRAADAVALFCYEIKKRIGAYAAALGGLGTLVFSGGIGENAPEVRARCCDGLEFLGIEIDSEKNVAGAAVISKPNAPVTVRVMRTDEELMIAKTVCRVLRLPIAQEKNEDHP
jgi:acetate kinase